MIQLFKRYEFKSLRYVYMLDNFPVIDSQLILFILSSYMLTGWVTLWYKEYVFYDNEKCPSDEGKTSVISI